LARSSTVSRFAQGVGDQLVLGLGQFGGGDRASRKAGHLGAQGGDPLLRRLAAGHDGVGLQIAGLLAGVGLEPIWEAIC
jgi:hypothetical protein